MLKGFTPKDSEYEGILIAQRIRFASVIIILLLLTIFAKVFYLTVIQHEHFTTLAKSNWLKITPIPPIRGLIYSREGDILAENKSFFSLEMIPEQITNIDELIGKLQKLITVEDSDIAKFKKLLDQKRRFESIPLRFKLTPEEVAIFSINRHQFPGVDIVARLNRHYPLGEELVHSIGYVARIDENDTKKLSDIEYTNYSGTTHIGKLGVEKFYESLLHGTVGYQQVEVNAQGRIIRVLNKTPAISGSNLYLTIDIALQRIALASLRNKRGAIVAIDPNNGDILAFVSSPTYDPNKFVNGIDADSYQALLNSKEKPLINRVISGKYPPGSTLKPFLGLVALEENIRKSTDISWCPGWFSLPGYKHRYRDWKKDGHGYTNLHTAIMQSCDVFFYILAKDLGIDRIAKGLFQFGFGRLTNIDMRNEKDLPLPSKEWKQEEFGQHWFPGDTINIGIGQGYMLSTPIQLAKATAALASRGKVIKPRLVAAISDAGQNEITPLPSDIEHEIKLNNPDHWQQIIAAMESVVHDTNGTAWRSGLDAPYRFAGKTGTAQIIGISQDEQYDKNKVAEKFQDHALFIAFAPIEQPQIAITIIVENGGSGSATAAPIARKLLDHFMNSRMLVSNG